MAINNFNKKLFQGLIFILVFLLSCQKEDEGTSIQITVDPQIVTLNINNTYQFMASISGTENKKVNWAITEGTAGGTISKTGLYKAPSQPGTYHIKVISEADQRKSSTTIVTVSAEPVIFVGISPETATIPAGTQQQFSATVENTSNASVTWSVLEGWAGGSITSAGLYTSPEVIGNYHVIATSQADASIKATATITVTANTEKEAAIADYNDYYLASALSDIGWTGNLDNCDFGNTPQSTKDKVLKRIHYYRKMVGLPIDITMNAVKSRKCQQAAVMSLKNMALNHYPPTTWSCYTEEGKEASGKSNLSLGNAGPNAITAYIRDQGDKNYYVGHRRWLLYPRLKEVGTGDTQSSNALWVVGDSGPTPASMPEFIAWPPKGYVPNSVVYIRWSFSIPGADFSNTTITMKDPADNNMDIVMEELNNGGYGDRTIVWKPQNVNLTSESDLTYQVQVKGVEVNGLIKNHTYNVTIFKP